MRTLLFKYLAPIMAIFFAYSANADNLHFEGDYVFSWSGIRIGKLHLTMLQDKSDYEVKSWLKTSGIVAMFSDHKSLTVAKGKTKKAHLQPIFYRSEYFSGGENNVVALKFDKGGKIIDEEINPPKRANRPDVPENLKSNVADNLTAILAMREEIKSAIKNGKTEMSVPVFDGKRRFNLHARMINAETNINLDGKSIPSLKLGLRREPVAGFKDKEIKRITEREPELDFFIEKKNLTLLGLQVPLYGGTVMAWVKKSCVNETCSPKQMALK